MICHNVEGTLNFVFVGVLHGEVCSRAARGVGDEGLCILGLIVVLLPLFGCR